MPSRVVGGEGGREEVVTGETEVQLPVELGVPAPPAPSKAAAKRKSSGGLGHEALIAAAAAAAESERSKAATREGGDRGDSKPFDLCVICAEDFMMIRGIDFRSVSRSLCK